MEPFPYILDSMGTKKSDSERRYGSSEDDKKDDKSVCYLSEETEEDDFKFRLKRRWRKC
jgi:hypothetical protein